MMVWAIVGAIAVAFGISFVGTFLTSRLAVRVGMVDVPGRHKAHGRAVPLLGGCAIFLAIVVPSVLVLALAAYWARTDPPAWLPAELAVHLPGAGRRVPAALGILAAAAVLHVMGLIDDHKHLGPLLKLAIQILAAAGVAIFCNVRVLTAVGGGVSVVLTVLWLVAITHAFNFLDNMDGLSAGMAAICATALLAASVSMGQVFVSAWLCLILGAVAGFLPHNFPPARTFMGDAGSLVIGFLLAVVSCLTTYVRPGQTYYLYGVFVPLVLMAVPLYDMISVVTLRLRERRNPMVGDRRHLSHRLVRGGMNVRKAVLTIYLCTLATALSASLLAHVSSNFGAILIFSQTVTVVLIVALLESKGAK